MKFKHKLIIFVVSIIIVIIGIICLYWGEYIDKSKPRSKSYTNEELDKIHSTLLSILERSLPILEKYNINYWGEGGTLLGSVREGKIIDWDDDIDLSVIKGDYITIRDNKELHKDLDVVGLELLGGSHDKRLDYGLLKLVNKQDDYSIDKIFIDILCYEKNGDRYILSNLEERSIWSTAFFKTNELFPLQKGSLNNIDINIPLKPEKYLERYYGEDWLTPKDDHNHKDEINLSI
jgi:phosphorylcholine metabolism protein LicD